jgi:hypothetical protein
VPPGEYDLWVVTAGRPMTRATVRVPDGGGEVPVELRMGLHGAIDARIDFGTSAPERGSVDARLVVDGSQPGGGVWSQGGTTMHPLRDVEPSFALERLVPGRWSVTFQGREGVARAEVEVLPGKRVPLVLSVVQAARVVFRADPQAPEDWILCDLAPFAGPQDAPIDETTFSAQVVDGRLRAEQRVLPGRYRWRAVRARVEGRSLEEHGDAQTGVLEAVAGETVEIVVR